MIMKTFRLLSIIIALNLFLGLSPQSRAQDGPNLCAVPTIPEPSPPNVLFLLDNSGSMQDVIRENDGTPTDQRRIDVLKQALSTMLENTHNANVGLARFASLDQEPEPKPNVPILFPVSHIEGLTHQIPGEPDDTIKKVTVSIAQSSDDAEESQVNDKTFLTHPQLQVVRDNKPHWIGLRFEAVDIPQGAKIVSAHLKFVSGTSASTPTDIVITAENVDDAQPFADERHNISNRPTTAETVSWNALQAWQEGTTYTSPDITNLVQTIINRSGWCGGNNALAFMISGSGEEPLRNIIAYDDSPSLAPRLIVEYDSKDINGTGCIDQNWSGQISVSADDAEERISYHLVFLNSPILELGQRSQDGSDPRLVGFRFKDVPLSPEAEIVKAHLILTSRNEGRDRPGTLSISGEKSPNASSFMRELKNLSLRPQTSTSVNWAPNETWETNQRYQSPDISALIQEIIQQPNWQTYNSLALFIQGNGRYDVAAFDNGPNSAAILRIQVKGQLGEDEQGDLMTVRRRLKNIVQNMEIHHSRTPLVDGLYEAAQYYLGNAVDYGQDRHGQSEYLVSHPGTYTGGIIEGITDECDINTNPHHDSCANEQISGNPVYVSPITSNDQPHHIVLLTDGTPTTNTSNSKIPALLAQLGAQTDCMTSYTVPNTGETQTISSAETCGIELAEALAENNIFVHVVALFLGKAWQPVYQDSETGQKIYQQAGIYYYEDGSEVPPDRIDLIEQAGYQEDMAGTQQNQQALKFLCRLASKGHQGVGSVNWCHDRYFHTANTIEEISTRIFPKILTAPSLAQLSISTVGNGTVKLDFAPPTVEEGIISQGNLDENVNCSIDCGTGCAETYMQSTATKLTAIPAPGFTFTSWSGDCNSTINPLMFITGLADTNCTATFEEIPISNHTLTVTTTGNGTVSSNGINCGTDCTETYTDNTTINLTVTPDSGSTFAGWTGTDCADSFAITADMNCTANFELLPPPTPPTPSTPSTPPTPSYQLKVTKTGHGTIKTIPTGINCGSDCQQHYNRGTLVTLTAIPANGLTFAGWHGTGCADSFTITSDMTCSANFLPIPADEISLETEADKALSTEVSHSKNEPSLPPETASDSALEKNQEPEEVGQSDIVGPTHIVISPHKMLSEVLTDEIVIGKPETTMPINLTLVNSETASDTFTIILTDSAGWTFGQMPTTIEIDGQSVIDFVVEVFLPNIGGEMNTLTITVTSQSNPERTSSIEVQIATSDTITEEHPIATLQETQESNAPIISESDMTPTTPAPIVENEFAPETIPDRVPETPIVANNQTTDNKENVVGSDIEGPIPEPTDTAPTTEIPVISNNDLVPPVTSENQTTGDAGKPTINEGSSETVEPVKPTIDEEHEVEFPTTTTDAPIVHKSTQCPSGSSLDWICNADGRRIVELEILDRGKLSNAVLEGILINKGWVSNLTITKDGHLTGGIVTGYIVNDGLMEDFEFRGVSIIGGTFSGTIYNNSEIGGFFKDVQLAPNTHIIGGSVAGNIQGDCEAPAQLENVIIKPNTQLSCVNQIPEPTTEDNEGLSSETTETSESDLPSETTDSGESPSETTASEELLSETQDTEELPILESAIAVNANGEITTSETLFRGGLAIDKGPFESSATVTLSDEVDIRGRIEIAIEHQRQIIDSLVVVVYQPLEDKPIFLMLDENGELLPWDFDMGSLVTLQAYQTPTEIVEMLIYQGQLPAIGMINIYFGYRLTDGTVVYTPQTLDVMVNDE
jgi:hypothetical protein